MLYRNIDIWQNDRYPFVIVMSMVTKSYYLSGSDDVDFTLSDNFSATAVYEGVSYSIVGYTNTLAQVSQIPDVPSASDSTPLMDGTASSGTTNEWSRADHVHPSDTSKMDGAAAYPAWDATRAYFDEIVSYGGRLWYAAETAGIGIAPPESPWKETTVSELIGAKQDALPYPTNAIPYAAISGAPSGGGQEWRVVNYDVEVDVVNYVTNGIAILTFTNAGYAYDINVSTNGWPEGASMFVRGSFRAGATYTIPYDLRLIGYGTWPTNNFQSVWWRSGTNIYVNVILEE